MFITGRHTAARLACAAVLVLGASIASAQLPAAFELHIAPDGNDDWSGEPQQARDGLQAGPLATLQGARDRIRVLRRSGQIPRADIIVWIAPGVYRFDEAVTFSAADSAPFGTTVRYRASKDGPVHFVGGPEINNFKTVPDNSILARLPDSARSHVRQADLKALGLADFPAIGRNRPGLELFYDAKPMTLARWPNDGWLTIASVPQQTNDRFRFGEDRPQRWTEAKDIWLHGYWFWDWSDEHVPVAKVDLRNRSFFLADPQHGYGYKQGQRYYALNILEELDTPGEWYLDRESGMLYFWPPEASGGAKAYVSHAPEIISLEGASRIEFEGITFEYTTGAPVRVTGGTSVVVDGCTIRNTGGSAIVINDGDRHTVRNCHIYATAGSGISLSGGDRKTLLPGGHVAENNHVHHYSRYRRTYNPGIALRGVGNVARHNEIHDAPHNGILLGGNEHLIEYNEIYKVCEETGDVGAFYMGRDWTQRGTVIRYNHFHDIHGPYTHGAMAVYLDDAASGITIYGNLFVHASRAAFIGGGRHNVVENNIFIECEPAVHVDARGLNWAKDYIQPGGGWHMYQKLEDMNYTEPPYSRRYPELVDIAEDRPAHPLHNVVRRNISVGGRWLDLPEVDPSWVTIQHNWTDGDPGFADAANGDYRLREGAAPLKAGFEQLPFERMGRQ